MPKVSVFMPSYNHAPFVAQAIASVQLQTFQDFEIVVTDDGSSDGTPNIIESLREPRLKLNRFRRNRGVCAATNNAISRCSGEYLSLLNSDDMFLKDKLELQAAYLDEHPEVGAVFGYVFLIDHHSEPLPASQHRKWLEWSERSTQPNRSQEQWLHDFFFHGNKLWHPTVMVRKKCYEQVGLYDERMAQLCDFEMWVRLVSAFPIHVIPRPVTAYRVLERTGTPNASDWSQPRTIIRHSWEDVKVRQRYMELPQQQFEDTFRQELAHLGIDPRQNRSLAIGRLCLATSSPVLHRFGLQLLWDALPPQSNISDEIDGFSHVEFIQETGSKDVFNSFASSQLRAEVEFRRQDIRHSSTT